MMNLSERRMLLEMMRRESVKRRASSGRQARAATYMSSKILSKTVPL